MTDLARFISLGGDARGCEFGEAQRLAGVESLDLLRWATISPRGLMTALETEFAGLGDMEYLELPIAIVAGRPQYHLRDPRFGFVTHSYVFTEDATREAVAAQAAQRFRRLREKLVDDLRTAEKLFVYRAAVSRMKDHELGRLRRSLARYGRPTLLYACQADEEHPAGAVEHIGDGLLIGCLDRFGIGMDRKFLPIPLDAWGALCREALHVSNSLQSAA